MISLTEQFFMEHGHEIVTSYTFIFNMYVHLNSFCYVCYKSYSFDFLSFLHTFSFQVLVTLALMLSHISLLPLLVFLSFFFFFTFPMLFHFECVSLYFYDTVARIDFGGVRDPQKVDLLDPKSGLFEPHPP